MKRSTMMLVGGALVAAGAGFLYYRKLHAAAEQAATMELIRNRGKETLPASTAGHKLVAIAGGAGAGAGRPLDTSTTVRLASARIPTNVTVSTRVDSTGRTINVRDHRG